MRFYQPKIEVVVYSRDKRYAYTDLHMAFEATLTRSSKPNQAKCTLYNLAPESRALFASEGQDIEISAGYDGTTSLVFKGSIRNVFHAYAPPDWATDIYSGDGQKQFDSAIFNRGYSAGTPIALIVADMAASYGMPLAMDLSALDGLTALSGVTYSGRVHSCLDRVTRDYDMRWSSQFGVIEVHRIGAKSPTTATVALVTPDSGLIGSPAVTEKGVAFVSMINPDLRPGRLVVIESAHTTSALDGFKKKKPAASANGTYLIEKVTLTGDNFGGDFTAECEAVIPS